MGQDGPVKQPTLPIVSDLRGRFEGRQRSSVSKGVAGELISIAGLVGRGAFNQAGAEVGRVVDVVSRWDGDDEYPAVSALVVRVGRRRTFIEVGSVQAILADRVMLASARIDLEDFVARPGEVLLAKEVIDHEVIDTNDSKLVRVSDLYIAQVHTAYRLVAVDVGVGSVVRRLGPSRLRSRATPRHVIDWADIHAFGQHAEGVRVSSALRQLRRMRPAELAVLLERLRREDRNDLLDTVDTDFAADALEEMGAEQLTSLLTDIPPAHAATLMARMEPDEAAEALRELDEAHRDDILAAMSATTARGLTDLLLYDEHQAGGFMTTAMVLAHPSETVREVRVRVAEYVKDHGELDAIIVIDGDGCLVDDITIVELFLGEADDPLERFVGPPWPITVTPEASEREVAERIVSARHSSVIVVDMDGRPIGRVFTDDILDSMTRQSERWRMPRRQ